MADFEFSVAPAEAPEPETPESTAHYVFTTADFLQQLQDLLPPGKLWTRLPDATMTKVLAGLAPEFARVQARADQMLLELNPGTAVETLDEHEEVNGLPDPCADPPSTTEGRQAALLARLRDNAGHNNADYVAVAETLGHTGTTAHTRPYLPFRAGVSRAGDRCYGTEWVFVYLVAYIADVLAASWTLSSATVTSSTEVAPDDGADAEEVLFSSGAGYIEKALTTPATSAQFDVWLRVHSGTVDVALELHRAGPVLVATEAVTITTQWTRYTVRGEHASGITLARINPASNDEIIVWGAKAGAVDPVVECRFNTIEQLSTMAEFRLIGDYVP
jgi:uncharacterized protein YmfQ (DUF2313 family)